MRRWIVILCICLAAPFSFAQENIPFQEGEDVSLSIMYKWGAINTEVGTAQLRVYSDSLKGVEAFHLDCRAWTAPFFDRFYKIREELHSWVRACDLRPLRFTRSTYEGGYTATNDFNYDWEAGLIRADVVFGEKGPQQLEIPIEEGDLDLISLLYYFRCLPPESYEPGAVTKVRFAIDDNVFDVYVHSNGIENIKIRRKGRMDAWHLSCSVVQGALFEGDEHLHLWLSADENRIPVAAKVPLKVGAVQAWLVSYDGLKNPFTSWTDGRKH